MRSILSKVPGVEQADVDFDSGTAVVQVRGDTAAEALTKALAASGQYGGTVVGQ